MSKLYAMASSLALQQHKGHAICNDPRLQHLRAQQDAKWRRALALPRAGLRREPKGTHFAFFLFGLIDPDRGTSNGRVHVTSMQIQLISRVSLESASSWLVTLCTKNDWAQSKWCWAFSNCCCRIRSGWPAPVFAQFALYIYIYIFAHYVLLLLSIWHRYVCLSQVPWANLVLLPSLFRIWQAPSCASCAVTMHLHVELYLELFSRNSEMTES